MRLRRLFGEFGSDHWEGYERNGHLIRSRISFSGLGVYWYSGEWVWEILDIESDSIRDRYF